MTILHNPGYKLGDPRPFSTGGSAPPPAAVAPPSYGAPAVAAYGAPPAYGAPAAAAYGAPPAPAAYGAPAYGGGGGGNVQQQPPYGYGAGAPQQHQQQQQQRQQPAGAYGGGGATGPVVRAAPDLAAGAAGGVPQPIASLNPYASRWTIKARCTAKTDLKSWTNAKGSGTLFSVDLLDEHGGEIRATFFK